ncbi:AAA family ATPase [Streptomyces griseoviridis]
MERDEIVGQLNDILAESAQGNSVVAVISGCATLGKTTLLGALKERAAASDIVVLSAVSAQEEQQIPYAMLSKLFGSQGAARVSLRETVAELVETGHGLVGIARKSHQAVAEMTSRSTVLLMVDDIQYADLESLHCLQYLAHGLRDRRLAVVFTWDPQPGAETPAVLRELLHAPGVRRIRLDSLSVDGVAQLLTDAVGAAESAELAQRYHHFTGGNPLLVNALRDEAWTGGPRDGAAFRRAVVLCMHRMGQPTVEVARGIAVLDGSTDLTVLSRLCGRSVRDTRRIVRKLNTAGVLVGMQFRHHVARAAVLDVMPIDELCRLRYDAARLLHEAGESGGSVVDRVIAAGPLPQEWVLPLLEEAAQRAVSKSDTKRAIAYLRFAVECCTDKRRRYAFQARVAEMYAVVDPATSSARFLALKAPVLAGTLETDEALRVARARLVGLDFDDAVEIIGHLSEAHDLSRLGDEWHLTALLLASTYPALLARLGVAQPTTLAGALDLLEQGPYELRAVRALTASLTQTAEEQTIARVERVLDRSQVGAGDLMTVSAAVMSLVYLDLLDLAAHWCDRLMDQAQERDDPVWQAAMNTLGAVVALRQGQMDAAVERAEEALAYVSGHGWSDVIGLLLGTLVEAHSATGNIQAAADCLSQPIHPALFDTRAGLHYLYARGRHHLAADRAHAALADFMACGERMSQWNIDTPALAPWRVGAAEAWLRMGGGDQAASLIEEHLLQFKTAGLPRARGIALRCLAAVRNVGDRPAILERALGEVQRGDDRYESSRVLADLSEAYRALGNGTKARTAARRARRIGKSCHKKEATDAPRAAMAPPCSAATKAGAGEADRAGSGDDQFAKLSDSERRVAVLAAAGYSNREIAARIYVTVSTVEQHLTRVYRKLRIRRREDLPMDFRADAV